jgi:short-subunit dehydrogenase
VGRAITRAFADEGARLALIARNPDGLEAAADEVRRRGGEAMVFPLDVADARAVDEAAERVTREWGGIDVWVNDAMASVFSPVVSYLGYVHGTIAALRYMRPRDSGVILQVGSALVYRAIPLQSAHSASSAAIRGFTDSLRSELLRERSQVAVVMLQLPAMNMRHPQPVPPIYQPEVIARGAVHAVVHPSREVWIGWSTTAAIFGQRILPGLLDHYLAWQPWDAQLAACSPTPKVWLRTHPGLVAVGATFLAALLR